MNTQTITLDISKQAAQTPVVTIGQCDSSGTTIKAKVYDNGIAADLDGMNAMFEMRLPDGKSYVRDGNCTVSGNEITYVVDEEHCAAVEGYSDECYFDILDGPSVIYSTARFRVVVMRSAHNASIEATSWDSEVDALIERGDAYMDYVEQYGIPLMGAGVRGGAKLGSGLAIADDALSVDTTAIVPQSEKGSAGGVAELNENGIVISSQLPSYVDDVVEAPTVADFPSTGETGKIYVATSANITYRWSGSGYVEISPSLALGETSATAYRGDRGADAYAHGVTNKGSAFTSDLYKITTNSEGHVTAATAVTAADIIAYLNGQALSPASVTATGAIQGSSISDGTGTLAQLRESVSQRLSYIPTIELSSSYGSTGITTQWCDEVHAAMGLGCGAAYVKSGFVSLVFQQGNDADYYSLLVLNYAGAAYCSHYPAGWVIKTFVSR